ncbi:MAG TPA: long-chain fatty acid--CoA ligase [Candidatus Eisenbacteria bacterium]|nr:long-chain fatty acid--CoA ligase [Candidatus Eisenbacteria bacterium]
MDVRTAPDLLKYAAEVRRKPDAFLVKREGHWVAVPIDAAVQQVTAMARQLRSRGLGKGDRVAILAESRLEWGLADLAVLTVGGVTVPIYPTLPANQVAPLLIDSGAVGAFTSSAAQRAKLEEARAAGGTALKWIHTFDEDPWPADLPGAVDPAVPLHPDDLATIIYTSGTTGTPKGVMLTHGNVVSEVLLALQAMQLRTDDTYLSFLPLSHIYERTNGLFTMLYAGVTIAYAESFDALTRNLREVKPTIVLSVPRLYEKVLAKSDERAGGAGFPTAPLWRWARRVAIEWAGRRSEGRPVPPMLAFQHALAGRIVYKKLVDGFGGRTRLRVSGGAALHREVALFFYGCGLPIFEGYGLTETSSGISVNGFDKHKVGTVGPLFRNIDVKFAEDGEILIRGPVVMKGYWNKPEATAEVLQDGWFHSGDIGEIDADGFLRITDRKKDLLVTSGGKKVAPQPIEGALKASPMIAEALLLGDGEKFVAALIAAADGASREQIAAEVERVNKSLAQFEQIRKFALIPNDLTVESGLMTPSLKLKRKAVIEHHRDIVARLFAEGA